MRCGVLALQGGFAAHVRAIEELGVQTSLVRTPDDFRSVDALIIPGGESTVINTLLMVDQLGPLIAERLREGMPALATCCGIIMLACTVEPEQETFSVLDVDVQRNAYGRQIASTIVDVRLAREMGDPDTMEGVFIRAPRVRRLGADVQVLGWRDDDPVLVRQGNIVAATFHPELTDDPRVHRFFVSCAEAR